MRERGSARGDPGPAQRVCRILQGTRVHVHMPHTTVRLRGVFGLRGTNGILAPRFRRRCVTTVLESNM